MATAKKLPKDVMMMIEKNNTVMAIKTLASDKGISMADAKTIVDAYEAELIASRDKKLAKIAKKQGVNLDNQATPTTQAIKDNDNASKSNLDNALSESVSNHLQDIGYKKPLIPYWVKRVIIMLLIIMVVIYVLWRQFR